MMETEERKQHFSNILGNVASIRAITEGMTYMDFLQNEQTKEMVFSYLQEIGEAAYELTMADDEIEDERDSLELLAGLRNARYNQEAEVYSQNIWNIIENDLYEIADEIEHSYEYA